MSRLSKPTQHALEEFLSTWLSESLDCLVEASDSLAAIGDPADARAKLHEVVDRIRQRLRAEHIEVVKSLNAAIEKATADVEPLSTAEHPN